MIPLGPNEDPITLSTASGEVLAVKGTFSVAGYSSEHQKLSMKFVDSDVEMPILAGSEITEGGAEGRELVITKRGGIIRDLVTGEQSQVVRRRGVYFIKLKIHKHYTKGVSTGFGRPGSP